MIFIELFLRFFRAGLFAVGGGLATLPFLYDIMHVTGWFTMQDLTNLIAVSECTPGPMGVNMATYVGHLTANIPGAVVATVGLVTPSVIIIMIVSNFLQKFRDAKIVQDIFAGLRPASTALIACAMCLVAKTAFVRLEAFQASGNYMDLLSLPHIGLAVILFVLIQKTDVHPILFIVAAGICGVVLGL